MSYHDLEERVRRLEEYNDLTAEEVANLQGAIKDAAEAIKAAVSNQQKIIQDTEEILGIYRNLKATSAVFVWVERFAGVAVKIAALGALIWALFKFGVDHAKGP